MKRLAPILLVMIVISSLSSLAAVRALASPTPDPAQGAATDLEEGIEPTPDAILVLTMTAEALPYRAFLPAMPCLYPAVTGNRPCNWIFTTLTPTPTKVAEPTVTSTSTFVPTAPPTGTPEPSATFVATEPTLQPTVTGTYPDLPPWHDAPTPETP